MVKLSAFFVLIFGLTFISNAQTGSLCSMPDSINSLPYVKTGLNTGDAGNNYTGTYIGATYMSGYDYVFRYKPTSDISIHIKITNVDYAPGVYVVKGCPDSPSAICLARDSTSNADLEILTVSLQADSTYYIIVSTHDYGGITATTNFNIEVTESQQYDLSIYTFWYPRSSYSLSNDQQVHLEVINIGYDTIHNFYLNYQINGGTVYTDYVDSTLVPGARYYHFFTQHQDMSAVGDYNFTLYSQLAGDGDLHNDTINVTIYQLDTVSAFPYFQDFETTSDWKTERVFSPGYLYNYSSWELGTPNKQIINTAASGGSNSWVMSLDSVYNNFEESYLISPAFDFSSLILPVFECDIWYETGMYDYALLEYSVDSGIHFNPIGTINDGINWYNTPSSSPYQGWTGSSGGWIHVSHDLSDLVGLSRVFFRIRYIGSTPPAEGLAVDNISIHESPLNDLGVIDIVNPTTKCGLTSSEDFTVLIKNFGLDTVFSFPVAYNINGGSFITDTVHQAIAPGDTLSYTFQNSVDFSAYGTYNLIAKTTIPTDQETINDSIYKEITNFKTITSYPYIEDFENNDGGFVTEGLNSSWQWGNPTDSIINSASSGNNAWVTNLSGYHNNPEQSYLTGNCFDFSNMRNPKVKIDVWYETISPSGGQLESTIDTGNSWQVMGQSATIDTNWYSSGYMWIGSSGQWKTVYQKLPTLINKQNVQFRIKFVGATDKSGLGIDNFIICDNPIAGTQYVYNGSQISFTDTSYNADSVKYIFSDGTIYTSSNPVYTISDDSVSLQMVAYNFCGTDTFKTTVYKTGINDNVFINNIKIYPNPASTFVQIDSKNSEIQKVAVYDVYGRKLKQYKLQTANYKLQISDLQQGVYFIKIQTLNGIVVKSIIKKK